MPPSRSSSRNSPSPSHATVSLGQRHRCLSGAARPRPTETPERARPRLRPHLHSTPTLDPVSGWDARHAEGHKQAELARPDDHDDGRAAQSIREPCPGARRPATIAPMSVKHPPARQAHPLRRRDRRSPARGNQQGSGQASIRSLPMAASPGPHPAPDHRAHRQASIRPFRWRPPRGLHPASDHRAHRQASIRSLPMAASPRGSTQPQTTEPTVRPRSAASDGGLPRGSTQPQTTEPTVRPRSAASDGGLPRGSTQPQTTEPTVRPQSAPSDGGLPRGSTQPQTTEPTVRPQSAPSDGGLPRAPPSLRPPSPPSGLNPPLPMAASPGAPPSLRPPSPPSGLDPPFRWRPPQGLHPACRPAISGPRQGSPREHQGDDAGKHGSQGRRGARKDAGERDRRKGQHVSSDLPQDGRDRREEQPRRKTRSHRGAHAHQSLDLEVTARGAGLPAAGAWTLGPAAGRLVHHGCQTQRRTAR